MHVSCGDLEEMILSKVLSKYSLTRATCKSFQFYLYICTVSPNRSASTGDNFALRRVTFYIKEGNLVFYHLRQFDMLCLHAACLKSYLLTALHIVKLSDFKKYYRIKMNRYTFTFFHFHCASLRVSE